LKFFHLVGNNEKGRRSVEQPLRARKNTVLSRCTGRAREMGKRFRNLQTKCK